MTDFSVERLCSHHDVQSFQAVGESGPWFNSYLRDRQNDFNVGMPNEPIVFVAVRRKKILGYIALRDLHIKSPAGEDKHYLLVPATATSLDNADPEVFRALVYRGFRYRDEVDSLHRIFRGVACIPHFSEAVAGMLDRLRFEKFLPPFDYFSWRSFRDFHEDDDR